MAKRAKKRGKPALRAQVEERTQEASQEGAVMEGGTVADAVYRRVGQEVLSGNLDPVCWAKALTESGSGHDEALALYARLRTEELTRQAAPAVRKKERLECRVARAYRETSDVAPMEPGELMKRGGMARAMDAMFWHLVAGVAALGCLMAAQVIWPELRELLTVTRVVAIVLAFQLIPIIGWAAAGRNGFFPALNYSEAAHISAVVAIAGSVMLGGYLLMGKATEPVVFDGEEAPGSLLVVMPEDELVRPVVHAEAVPAKPVQVVSTEGE